MPVLVSGRYPVLASCLKRIFKTVPFQMRPRSWGTEEGECFERSHVMSLFLIFHLEQATQSQHFKFPIYWDESRTLHPVFADNMFGTSAQFTTLQIPNLLRWVQNIYPVFADMFGTSAQFTCDRPPPRVLFIEVAHINISCCYQSYGPGDDPHTVQYLPLTFYIWLSTLSG